MSRLTVIPCLVILWTAHYGPVFGESLRMAVATQLLSTPVYVAEDNGYFKREGLDVEIVDHPLGKGALGAMLHNDVDVAVAAETPLVHASLAGEHFAIIATIGRSTRALCFLGRRDRGIDEFKRVRGKKIGVTFGTNAEFFFETLRVISGIPKESVELEDVPPENLESSMEEGKVDGICAWEPIISNIKRDLTTNIFQFDGKGVYEWSWNLVSTKRFLTQHESAVAKLLRALVLSGEELEKNPAAAAAIVEKRLGLRRNDVEKLLERCDFKPELRQELILQLEAQARWFTLTENQEMPNYLRYVNTSFLKRVSPRSVTIVE